MAQEKNDIERELEVLTERLACVIDDLDKLVSKLRRQPAAGIRKSVAEEFYLNCVRLGTTRGIIEKVLEERREGQVSP
jgi:hypothetical protein